MPDSEATPCKTAWVSDVLSWAAKAAFNSNTSSSLVNSEFRQTALKRRFAGSRDPEKNLERSGTPIRDHVECDGEARLFALKGHRAVPEIRRKQHQLPQL